MSSDVTSLRFAVLRHEGHGEAHFDLLFEITPGSDLATWRSPDWPILQPTELLKLKPHRRAYLQFEGQIPGDRGSVHRIAEGTYRRSESENQWHIQFIDPPNLPPIRLRPLNSEIWQADPKN